MYFRKTKDVYEIHVNYGQGWEYEIAEYSFREARNRIKEYRDNCPEYPVKVVRKRERINQEYLRDKHCSDKYGPHH